MNVFEVGTCIEWLGAPNTRIDVVLWISANRGHCVCIDTNRKHRSADPIRWSTIDIEDALACGKAKVVPFGTGNSSVEFPGAPSEKACEDREKAWQIIEPLVFNPQIFDRKVRRQLIKKQAEEKHVGRKVILKYLRLYWQAGMKKT